MNPTAVQSVVIYTTAPRNVHSLLWITTARSWMSTSPSWKRWFGPSTGMRSHAEVETFSRRSLAYWVLQQAESYRGQNLPSGCGHSILQQVQGHRDRNLKEVCRLLSSSTTIEVIYEVTEVVIISLWRRPFSPTEGMLSWRPTWTFNSPVRIVPAVKTLPWSVNSSLYRTSRISFNSSTEPVAHDSVSFSIHAHLILQ